MDATHFHLVVNHVPILGTVFALVLGLAGAALRKPDLLRAALIGFVVVGAASLAATKSGEEAEDTVEGLPGVTEQVIHAHEEAAEVANYGAIALAVVALVALAFAWSSPLPVWATAAVLLVALGVSGLMVRAGNLGGEIRHTEIRAGGAAAAGTGAAGETGGRPAGGERDDDD